MQGSTAVHLKYGDRVSQFLGTGKRPSGPLEPPGSGNGRVARLLTHAVLVQQRFTWTPSFRALNPTAVFGADRDRYYEPLADEDTYRDSGLVRRCEGGRRRDYQLRFGRSWSGCGLSPDDP